MLNKRYILNNITLVNLYCGMERGGRGVVVGLLPEPLRLDTLTLALDKKTVKVHSKFCS